MNKILILFVFLILGNSLWGQAYLLPDFEEKRHEYEVNTYNDSLLHTAFCPVNTIYGDSGIGFPLQYTANVQQNLLRISPLLNLHAELNADILTIPIDLGVSLEAFYHDKFYLIYHLYGSSVYGDVQRQNLWLNQVWSASFSPNPTFNFRLGQGTNHLGDGFHSLFLSRNSPDYPFFSASATVWRLKYQVMLLALKDEDHFTPTPGAERKYSVNHFLSFNIGKTLNINVFETVVWAATDSSGHRGIDPNYLNPIVFYRPVEFAIGSPDNVILGAGGKWQPLKKLVFYGQALLDELVVSELRSSENWWGNKYALQAGLKIYDPPGIKNFMIQAEYNYLRPFVYSHDNPARVYGTQKQPLAHPLGGNGSEYFLQLSYHYGSIYSHFRFTSAKWGADTDSSSMGHNPYLPYDLREADYGHVIYQGQTKELQEFSWYLSYDLPVAQDMFAFVQFAYRKNEMSAFSRTTLSFGIKTGILPQKRYYW